MSMQDYSESDHNDTLFTCEAPSVALPDLTCVHVQSSLAVDNISRFWASGFAVEACSRCDKGTNR
jgi:hypothetical protein